jgi:hypothetical protein
MQVIYGQKAQGRAIPSLVETLLYRSANPDPSSWQMMGQLMQLFEGMGNEWDGPGHAEHAEHAT